MMLVGAVVAALMLASTGAAWAAGGESRLLQAEASASGRWHHVKRNSVGLASPERFSERRMSVPSAEESGAVVSRGKKGAR